MSNGLPAITAGSLDGFIAGVLVAGACFLAIIVPWRGRKRRAVTGGPVPPPAEVVAVAWDPAAAPAQRPAALEDTMTTAEEPLTLVAEPVARTEVRDSAEHGAAARDHLRAPRPGSRQHGDLAAAGSHRRWRQDAAAGYQEEVLAPSSAPRRELTAAHGPELAGAQARELAAAQARVPPGELAPQGRPARAGEHRAPHPLGDPTFDDAAGMPRPPGARHLPRHAAPSPGLGGRMTGVLSTRSVPNGSRGLT